MVFHHLFLSVDLPQPLDINPSHSRNGSLELFGVGIPWIFAGHAAMWTWQYFICEVAGEERAFRSQMRCDPSDPLKKSENPKSETEVFLISQQM